MEHSVFSGSIPFDEIHAVVSQAKKPPSRFVSSWIALAPAMQVGVMKKVDGFFETCLEEETDIRGIWSSSQSPEP